MSIFYIRSLHYVWLIIGSFIAGVLSAMASGGSFVSFPAILGVGVLPVQANATNTVAQWPGQALSAWTLRDDLQRRLLPAAIGASLLGGITGAELLLHTAQSSFLRIVPWLILLGTGLFAASAPLSRWLWARSGKGGSTGAQQHVVRRRGVFFGLLPVAVYLGYFGAGSGFMVLTVMALLGLEDMHQLNAMKTFVVTFSNFIATVMFLLSGAVVWHVCLVALVSSIPGGYLGARLARRADPRLLRIIVTVTGCVVAAYFFWSNHRSS